uniref:NADH dehydrogenase [ubiquinone] 1 beta subcomplex subunit 7 n=1 Tax=Panagrolaimus sp. JU765 TaxID=591449 RepID=A0AC34QL67_9BILA
MGQKVSTTVNDHLEPDTAPRPDRPSTFDPLAGFEHGRKKREMKVTWEEMDQYGLSIGQRDYCAHKLIPLIKCQTMYAPAAGHMCDDKRHAWDQCEYEDYIMRMKEYEREKRLLIRKKKKEASGLA